MRYSKDNRVFEQKFFEFLQQEHPDVIYNNREDNGYEDIVRKQAEVARDVFLDEMINGADSFYANEKAMDVLFAGYKESKYKTVFGVIEDNLPEKLDMMGENELRLYVINIVNQCEDIFENYGFGDDYIHQDKMDYEIIGAIETME